MILPTGRNVPGGWIGASKSPFKTSAGAADEAKTTPMALAMTIDFDNFINCPCLLLHRFLTMTRLFPACDWPRILQAVIWLSGYFYSEIKALRR
jgi:hypothetical protein